jgi:hypothetical protein
MGCRRIWLRLSPRSRQHKNFERSQSQRVALPVANTVGMTLRCQKQPSFNYLVGASDNRRRNTQSKCGSRLEVQDKFEGDRLLDRKLCWFGSLKYLGGVLRRLSTHQSEACPIAREAT